MKKHFTFFGAEHKEMGNVGFIPNHNPHFEPGDGLMVAHDIFEHNFKNDDGGMHFEMMAVGVSLFFRDSNYFHENNSRSSIGSIWSEIFHQMAIYYKTFNYTPTHKWYKPYVGITKKLYPEIEEIISEMFEEGFANNNFEIINNLCSSKELLIIQQLKETGQQWVRKGYRYAERKWKNTNSLTVLNMFEIVKNEIDKIINKNNREEIINSKLLISIDNVTNQVEIIFKVA